jgi:hypothetical protein
MAIKAIATNPASSGSITRKLKPSRNTATNRANSIIANRIWIDGGTEVLTGSNATGKIDREIKITIRIRSVMMAILVKGIVNRIIFF